MAGIVVRLWQMSIQACPLIIIVYLAGIFLKRYPKLYGYVLWALVGFRLLCPVFVPSPLSLQPDMTDIQSMEAGWRQDSERYENIFSLSGLSEEEMTQSSMINPISDDGIIADTEIAEHADDTDGLMPAIEDTHEEFIRAGVFFVLTVLYISGVVFFVIFYLAQYLIMKRHVVRAVREKENIWLCENIQSPFVMGVVSPQIYLPYELEEPAKRHVINHEKSHIMHHDPLIRMIGLLCICLHWWNPLVWFAVKRMNRDMEMFCDEGFLISAPLAERKAYAETLLSYAAVKSGFSIELAFGESGTEERIRNVLRNKKKSVFVICVVILLAALCVVLFMTVPNVVGFAEKEDYAAVTPDSGKESDEAGANSVEDTGGESKLIEAQTFDVEFAQLGYVTFASYSPDLTLSPYADVTFKLLRDEVEIYTFSTVYSTEVRQDERRFKSLDAVAFADINEDGYTDVLTIATYTYMSDTEFMEARIFTGRGGTEFVEESYLEEDYNQSHDEMSIGDLKEFIARPEKQDYYVGNSIYGRWRITDYSTNTVYAMSQDEIDSFLGKTIEYGRYWYRLEGDEDGYVVDGYSYEVMTPNEFEQFFGIDNFHYDLYSNNIKVYTLENARRSYVKDYENDTIFGQFFYMTSENTAVISLDGVLFLLERQ